MRPATPPVTFFFFFKQLMIPFLFIGKTCTLVRQSDASRLQEQNIRAKDQHFFALNCRVNIPQNEPQEATIRSYFFLSFFFFFATLHFHLETTRGEQGNL